MRPFPPRLTKPVDPAAAADDPDEDTRITLGPALAREPTPHPRTWAHQDRGRCRYALMQGLYARLFDARQERSVHNIVDLIDEDASLECLVPEINRLLQIVREANHGV